MTVLYFNATPRHLQQRAEGELSNEYARQELGRLYKERTRVMALGRRISPHLSDLIEKYKKQLGLM